MDTKIKIDFDVNKIYLGDCAVVMADKFPDSCIDLIVTSPPYDDLRNYEGYVFEFEDIAAQMFRVLKDGGIAVWVVGDRIKNGRSLTSFKQALFFQSIGFRMHDIIIYEKLNTPFMRANAYTNCYEFMFVLSKGLPKTFNPLRAATVRRGEASVVYGKGADGENSKRRRIELGKEKVRANIWAYAVGLGGTTNDRYAFEHPALFPEKLARDHILSWSNPDDLVLDPLCGAGTTLKMARLAGRQWVGIEISREYVEIAERRVREEESLFSELNGDGKSELTDLKAIQMPMFGA